MDSLNFAIFLCQFGINGNCLLKFPLREILIRQQNIFVSLRFASLLAYLGKSRYCLEN